MGCINSMPAIVIVAVAQALEAQHHCNALFHAPVVLLDQIAQVLRRPQLRVGGQQANGFQLAHPAMRRSIAVQSDRPRSIVLAFDCLPKERLGATSLLALSRKSTVRPARSTARYR